MSSAEAFEKWVTDVEKERDQLRDQVAQLRAALEQYAACANWINEAEAHGGGIGLDGEEYEPDWAEVPESSWCAGDRGTVARAALEATRD